VVPPVRRPGHAQVIGAVTGERVLQLRRAVPNGAGLSQVVAIRVPERQDDVHRGTADWHRCTRTEDLPGLDAELVHVHVPAHVEAIADARAGRRVRAGVRPELGIQGRGDGVADGVRRGRDQGQVEAVVAGAVRWGGGTAGDGGIVPVVALAGDPE